GGVGAVDHGGVEEGGDLVGLLAGVAGAGAGAGHGLGAGEGHDLGAGALGVEERVALGNADVEPLGRGGAGEGQGVVDDLAPGVDHGRQLPVAFDVRIALVHDGVADEAATGPGATGGGGDAVGVAVGPHAEQGDADAAPVLVDQVVTGAVEGAEGKV